MIHHRNNAHAAHAAHAETYYRAGLAACDRQDFASATALWQQAVCCDDANELHHASLVSLLDNAQPAARPAPGAPRAPRAPQMAPAPVFASAPQRPAYAHLTERLRNGPPVSPATLGPCRADALYSHRQMSCRPLEYSHMLSSYGMSRDHYNTLFQWLDAEAKHKFRAKLIPCLLWTPAAFLTSGMAYIWMFSEREKYAEKHMTKVCEAVTSEYADYGISITFKGKEWASGCSYTIEAQGGLWRDFARAAG